MGEDGPAEVANGFRLGVDLGTTFTAAAIRRGDQVQMVTLGVRHPEIPSVIAITNDEIVVGDAAERLALVAPGSIAREFKRRIGDPTPLIVNSAPWSAEALTGRLLAHVLDHIKTAEGEPPGHITITHPANWHEYKLDHFRQALMLAGCEDAQLVPEPVAAAHHYAAQGRISPGQRLAVFDFGGGTFDTAIVHATSHRIFDLVGRPKGLERLGGVDLDYALFTHVLDVAEIDLDSLDDTQANRQAVGRLRSDCRDAKEYLSVDTSTAIPIMLPSPHTEVRINRTEFEDMIRQRLTDATKVMAATIAEAGLDTTDIDGVVLVGGTSRIPIVSQVIGEQLQLPVFADAHPKHSIAAGATHAPSETDKARASAFAPSGSDSLAPARAEPRSDAHPRHGIATAAAYAPTETEKEGVGAFPATDYEASVPGPDETTTEVPQNSDLATGNRPHDLEPASAESSGSEPTWELAHSDPVTIPASGQGVGAGDATSVSAQEHGGFDVVESVGRPEEPPSLGAFNADVVASEDERTAGPQPAPQTPRNRTWWAVLAAVVALAAGTAGAVLSGAGEPSSEATSDSGEASAAAATVTFPGSEPVEVPANQLDEFYDTVVNDSDFVAGAYGADGVPADLRASMLSDMIIDVVVDDLLDSRDAEVSAENQAAGAQVIEEAVAAFFPNEADSVAAAQARFETLPYLPFLADLWAKQLQLGDELTADDSGETVEIPCASHILLDTEAEAEDVVGLLEDGGDFVELAMLFSIGPTGPNGGDLGCTDPVAYVDEFAAAITDAPVGTIIGPVQTEFGFHVITVTGIEEQAVGASDPGQLVSNALLSAIAQVTVEVTPSIGTWDEELGQVTSG